MFVSLVLLSGLMSPVRTLKHRHARLSKPNHGGGAALSCDSLMDDAIRASTIAYAA
jgi:hypothetical protein